MYRYHRRVYSYEKESFAEIRAIWEEKKYEGNNLIV